MNRPRHIVLTGVSSGIGLSLARRLSERHRLLVTARHPGNALGELIETRPDITFLAIDQQQPEDAASKLAEAIEARGWDWVDNAILNAGTGWAGEPHLEPAERLRDTLNVNLAAPIAIAHVLYPFLEKREGRLTLIGSTARKGAGAFAGYAASKAGLHGFARALREEWRGRVSVQMLHPGPVKTAMHVKAGFDPGWIRNLFLSPDDMAMMIEKAAARGPAFQNLTHFRYWNGAGLLGRNL